MEELIGSIDLEARIIRYSTDDGSYLLRVYDRESGNEVIGESMALSPSDNAHNLTHIPSQQIGKIERYLYHPVTGATVLLGGVYLTAQAQGAGRWAAFSITMLATLELLRKLRLFNDREREFNEVLSRYGLPTLEHSKTKTI